MIARLSANPRNISSVYANSEIDRSDSSSWQSKGTQMRKVLHVHFCLNLNVSCHKLAGKLYLRASIVIIMEYFRVTLCIYVSELSYKARAVPVLTWVDAFPHLFYLLMELNTSQLLYSLDKKNQHMSESASSQWRHLHMASDDLQRKCRAT